jgi:hypothetical protein
MTCADALLIVGRQVPVSDRYWLLGAPAYGAYVARAEVLLGRAVCDLHDAGQSQRAVARDLNLDRRKVRRIIKQAA